MLQRIFIRSFCCCISLERGCTIIGALEWCLTLYLSCRYYDISDIGCKGLKISCSQIYYNVLSFVVSAAIISGVNKNNRVYFVPWLITKTVEYGVFTALMIYDLQSRIAIHADWVPCLIFVIITILVFWYSWFCVLSLYFNMDQEKDEDQNDSQLQELV